ncbi:MAG: GGDEF domain-containing protein [Thermoanaerobaculia bacterium]
MAGVGPVRRVPRLGALHWAVVAWGGGLALLVVAALPRIGAVRLVFGLSLVWILLAALLMLLGLAQVIRYAVRLEHSYELSVAKLAVQEDSALLSPDEVHFDLALKMFLLASRHQRPLSCIAIEIDRRSLAHLLDEAGWEAADSAIEASALGLVAMEVAGVTRRSDLTIKGSEPRQLVVLCPETGRVGALRVARKIDHALRELKLEMHLGVSTFPGDASSLRELLERAESELRHSGDPRDTAQLALEFSEWDESALEGEKSESAVTTRSA